MTQTSTAIRFRRSNRDKVIAGVAGGLGRYLGVDPVIVRLVLAVAAFAGGIGLLAYVLAWVIVPADDDPSLDREGGGALDGSDAGRVIGAVLVVLALLALGDHWWAGDLIFPAALIALGAWLILRPRSEPDVDAERPTTPVGSVAGGGYEPPPTATTQEAEPDPTPLVPPPPMEPRSRRHRGFPTGRATTGVIAVLAGSLGLAAANGADISAEAVLLSCLAVCGAGLLVGAFVGRARGLIALAIPLGLALAAVTAIDVPFEGGIGERHHAPDELAEVDDEYRLGVGEMVIDLRGLDADELRGAQRRIEASIGIGSLQVFLPPGVSAEGEASAELGDVNVLGARAEGADAERRIDLVGPEGQGSFELDLRVGLGEVIVR